MNTFINDIKSGFSKPNNTLYKLLLINSIVFVPVFLIYNIFASIGLGTVYNLLIRFLALPASLDRFVFTPWTLITYNFLHRDFFHVLFNMLNLYYFGWLVQEYLGTKKLLALYILGGLAGGVLYLLAFNFIPFYQVRSASYMMGASASVLAIIVAAATLLPDYTFFLLLLGPVRIKYITLVLVLLSVSGITGGNAGGNLAHLGGAVLGFIYIKQLKAGTDLGKPILAVTDWLGRLFKKRSPIKVSYVNKSKSANFTNSAVKPASSITQKEIDVILDKISKTGYESLSKDEKQRLFKASRTDKLD